LSALPKDEIMDEIHEQELCIRYLNAALSPLFDDPEKGYFFRWTSTNSMNAPNSVIGRPDVMISALRGVTFTKNIGFGEMKSMQQCSNNFVISKDLIRLGLFSKEAINNYNLKGCLAIQSVGFTTTFYISTLMGDGIYTMIEIGSITVPSAISNLGKYLIDFDIILNILSIHEQNCKKTVEESSVFSARKRSASNVLDSHQLSSTRDRNRQCITSHNYH
ncbi:hypothetical protein INT45_002603, partial [Circinella minor]